MQLPKQYNPKESEPKWQRFWEKEKIYKFNPKSKAEVYSIDTPPPTVSGKMHLGHAFSYSQQDFVVRFQRMLGKNIFYPFGTDNNGLATERLIEKTKKISAKKMDRKEFVEICLDTLKKELVPEYVSDMKNLAISCDWDIFYTTIDSHCQKISQRSFIDLYKNNRVYKKKTPIMICPLCSTAIAQVEMEDVQKSSTLNYIKARLDSGEYLIYATTRPELIPGCVGMSINKDGTYVKAKKDDEIWIISKEALEKFKDEWSLTFKEELKGKDLVGQTVTIPLTKAKKQVTHDQESKTEYGTGIVYYCTYGGAECVEWMQRHKGIKPIHIMGIDGKYNSFAGKYQGMDSLEARKQVLIDLEEDNSLVKKEQISHVVNVHERCGTDIEYVATEQWFIKYLDLREQFLKDGAKLNWYPKHMKQRLDNWIKGLKWDWCISRQRFFGVPFPVWYCKKCNEVILPKEEDLPVDPLKDKPKIKECPKCKSNEFIPEKDILDTWATSSLTPRLAIELMPENIQKKLYPMSLRPQAHDIITFWLFNTLVKSQLHYNVNPWEDVMISGHALDPKGKKMSKSKGNVVEPQKVIEQYSADCLRFWAAGSKLGDDLPYMEKDLITGKKFITKLWNASKFAIMHLEDYKGQKPKKIEVIDRWILSKLNHIIKESTQSFTKYEYSRTKAEVENFFWHEFCDNYLEIIKDRLYNPDQRGKEQRLSAQYGLYHTLLAILKMMAPIMPNITEEIYQLYWSKHEDPKSIHISLWPKQEKSEEKAEKIGNLAVYAIQKARQAKSEQNLSLKSPLKNLIIKGKISKEDFELAKQDIISATKTGHIEYEKLKEDSKIDEEVKIEL